LYELLLGTRAVECRDQQRDGDGCVVGHAWGRGGVGAGSGA
jgi:hypothetical protein